MFLNVDTDIMIKPEVKLENWSVSGIWPCWVPPISGHPSCEGVRLAGEVYGHGNFGDGERVYSTRILEIQGIRIETKNTIYMLGKIEEAYHEWCVDEDCYVPTEDEPIKVNEEDWL